jgi:hypothetical protein
MNGRTQAFRSDRDGFAAYGLRSEAAELAVVPCLGAALVSLRAAGGQEWMHQGPDSGRLFPNQPGDPFERSPLVGAVECIPTVGPCMVDGSDVADHGEAWSAAWEIDLGALQQNLLRTSVSLPLSGLDLSRTTRLDGSVATFEYRLRNRTAVPRRYLWAFHPLFAVGAGDRLELDEHIESVVVTAMQGIPGVAAGRAAPWPEPAAGIRLDTVDPARYPDSFVKMFAACTGLPKGWARLCRGAERLTLRFDPQEVPAVGIWLTCGGWHRETHLAIEPTNGLGDRLVEAGASLEPSGQRNWSFEIEIARVAPAP